MKSPRLMERVAKADRVVRHKLPDGTLREYRYPAYAPKRREARHKPRTLGALINSWQRSPEWTTLAENTQRSRIHYLRPLRKLLQLPIDQIERKHVIAIRNQIAEAGYDGNQGSSPAAANEFVATVSSLFSWGLDAGMATSHPALRIKPIKGGHLPHWTMELAELAMRHMPEHLRRAVVLALYTGQRRSDLTRMRWSDYDGQFIKVKQRKTGAELTIPVHPVLKAELDTWRDHPICNKTLTDARVAVLSTLILTNSRGKSWFDDKGRDGALSVMMTHSLSQIESFPSGYNIHGLRKLAGNRLAEAGCSPHEIMSILGHSSLAMAELYTRGADRKSIAVAAITKLAAKDAVTPTKPAVRNSPGRVL